MEWTAVEWIIAIIAGLYIFSWIRIVGPDEAAVMVIFGVPWRIKDSGITFVPRLPKCYLARYPKKIYNLDYPARLVISKEGEHPEASNKFYGVQVLTVDSVAYLRFPADKKDGKLIEILKSQVPIKDEDLKNWTEESVVGAIRVSLGKITWKQGAEDIATVRTEADKAFKDKDGILITAGFRKEDLRLTIKEIKLPKKLEEAFPTVDVERLEAEAAPYEARQRATETIGTIIEMMAQSRGLSPEKIQEGINASTDLQKEFLGIAKDLVTREMAIKGKSFVDVRVQGAEGLERMFLNALAVWKRMPLGGGESETKEPSESESKKSSGTGFDEARKTAQRRTEEEIKKLGSGRKKKKRG